MADEADELAQLLSIHCVPLIKCCADAVSQYQLEWISSAVLSSCIQHMSAKFSAGRREELSDVVNALQDAFDHSFTVVRKEVQNQDDCSLCMMIMKKVVGDECEGLFTAFMEAGVLHPDITAEQFQGALQHQLRRSRPSPPPQTEEAAAPPTKASKGKISLHSVGKKLGLKKEKNPLIDKEPKKEKSERKLVSPRRGTGKKIVGSLKQGLQKLRPGEKRAESSADAADQSEPVGAQQEADAPPPVPPKTNVTLPKKRVKRKDEEATKEEPPPLAPKPTEKPKETNVPPPLAPKPSVIPEKTKKKQKELEANAPPPLEPKPEKKKAEAASGGPPPLAPKPSIIPALPAKKKKKQQKGKLKSDGTPEEFPETFYDDKLDYD